MSHTTAWNRISKIGEDVKEDNKIIYFTSLAAESKDLSSSSLLDDDGISLTTGETNQLLQNTLLDLYRFFIPYKDYSFPLIEITTEEVGKIVSTYDILYDKFKILKEKPNKKSVLLAITSQILCEHCSYHASRRAVDNGWPCPIKYESQVLLFDYMQHDIEISILHQSNQENVVNRYFIVVNIPESEPLYHAELIPSSWIPTFSDDVKEQELKLVAAIALCIVNVNSNFTFKYVQNGRLPSKEFSKAGIKPVFSNLVQPKKKKNEAKKKRPNRNEEFVFKEPPWYKRLLSLYQKSDPKPTDLAILFALIHDTLVGVFGFTTGIASNEWSGSVSYTSQTVVIYYPNPDCEQEDEDTSKPDHRIFEISLMKNEKEFYFSIEPLENTSRKNLVVNKLNKDLVLSFDSKEKKKDAERGCNITMWLNGIINNYVKKICNPSSSSTSPCASDGSSRL